MSAQDYEKHLKDVVHKHFPGGKLSLSWETVPEARLHKSKITQAQKELRLLKKTISAHLKLINASYSTAKSKVGNDFGSGLLGGFFGKKALGKNNAQAKDKLRRKQVAERLPYESVIRNVDGILAQLDEQKLRLDSWIVSHNVN